MLDCRWSLVIGSFHLISAPSIRRLSSTLPRKKVNPMSSRKLTALAAVLVLIAGFAQAQTTGEIYGKATDKSGAVVPGVTVTLSSPALLQPQVAVTSGTGVYRFPSVPIGVYTVKFELAGFTTVVREGVRIEIGKNAQINGGLDISSLQEVVTITGEAPLIDMQSNARASNFNQEALQNIPSARDPWVILQQSAGIVMDRENIGGNMSGQQSNFVARGAATNQQKWNLDGVDITDMAATGASPIYYDFDSFEEMQISTGGADVTMMTPGVGINLVTKSGTDRFRGSARYFVTDQNFQSTNVTDAIRQQGATSGNPIQNIKDWGGEMGGPIVKGKIWAWASYGVQNVKVGVNNFFLKTPDCINVTPTNAATTDFQRVKDCLNTDLTQLKNFNGKLDYQVARNTRLSLFVNTALKYRNARGADDLHPIETTNVQQGVADPKLGSKYWKTGTPKTYKASLRRIFSDRFMLEAQYAHVGNNFVLDFHEPALAAVQPSFEITTSLWGRSFNASQFVRPANIFDITGTRSTSGFLGADHAVKFGIRHRQDRAISTNHRGGNVEARFRNGVATEANLYRDSYTDYNVFDQSAYLQDTITKGRLTAQVGLRLDHQWDRTNSSIVAAHPFFGQTTQTGAPFNQLPAVNFAGADGGVTFTDLVPRLGFSYDVKGDGRNVIKANYARYAAQLGDGDIASTYNPVVATFVRYPWTDLNGDKFVQPGEVNITGNPLAQTGGYNAANPSALVTSGKNDPNLTNEHVDELIVGFNKQFSNTFAMGIAGIYRQYRNFRWFDTIGLTSDNYVPVSFTAPPSTCPASQNAQCPTVTYYQPNINLGTVPNYIYTNASSDQFRRDYRGVELTWRKRTSSGLTINGSFTWSNTPVHATLTPATTGALTALFAEDPSNLAYLNGGQFAPQSAGSGIDNIFINAKWLARLQAAYTIPWQQIGVALAYNGRSGYPNPQGILSPTRANGSGTTTVYLTSLGDNRLDTFNNVDFRADKTVTISGNRKITLSADVFNVMNADTIQSRRRNQNAANANLISSLVAPRVIRFGARLAW